MHKGGGARMGFSRPMIGGASPLGCRASCLHLEWVSVLLFLFGTSVSCKVGPSIHVISSLAIERKHTCDLRVDIALEVFGRFMGGLRWGSGPIGWSVDPLCGPTTTQSPLFSYLQANNDISMWIQVICTKITTSLLVIS